MLRHCGWLIVPLLLSRIVAPAGNAPSPSFPPFVAVMGCSNSKLIYDAYIYGSVRDAAWNGATPGATLMRWTSAFTGFQQWATFDQQLALNGQPSAVWWPVCLNANSAYEPAQTLDVAQQEFIDAYTLLRQRVPTAVLYLTPTLGSQADCSADNDILQVALVDWAVGAGYALRGPDIPPASKPARDHCHFDAAKSTNVQAAAVAFLDQ